jgi:hypothetical protein
MNERDLQRRNLKPAKPPKLRSSAAEEKCLKRLTEINNRLEALQRDVSQIARRVEAHSAVLSDMSPTTKLLEEIARLNRELRGEK